MKCQSLFSGKNKKNISNISKCLMNLPGEWLWLRKYLKIYSLCSWLLFLKHLYLCLNAE